MFRFICLVIGYLFGLIQTGYLYGKTQGIDIRTVGSGNAGATNSLRVLGAKAGAIVFFGDGLKTLIPVLLVRWYASQFAPDLELLYAIYMGLGVVLGHNYPVTLNFRGGKGIAATGGFALAMDPGVTLLMAITFGTVVFLTKYVSLGSLIVVTEFAILGIFFTLTGVWELPEAMYTEFIFLLIFWAAMAFFRHRQNIVRLIRGNENKIHLGKKK